MILQKQIDHIQGNKDNIIIPYERMRLIREQASSNQPASAITQEITRERTDIAETNSATNSSVINPCIICFQDEKRLACIPCGHFTACIPCSHSLRLCPVCRQEIEAFVRIYI
jgi:hypothetical protein